MKKNLSRRTQADQKKTFSEVSFFTVVIPHSEVGNKPERGIGETHGAATLNGP